MKDASTGSTVWQVRGSPQFLVLSPANIFGNVVLGQASSFQGAVETLVRRLNSLRLLPSNSRKRQHHSRTTFARPFRRTTTSKTSPSTTSGANSFISHCHGWILETPLSHRILSLLML